MGRLTQVAIVSAVFSCALTAHAEPLLPVMPAVTKEVAVEKVPLSTNRDFFCSKTRKEMESCATAHVFQVIV